ncbi:MAG: S9 family peptidase [Pseudomonadota bacterium]
MSQPPRKPFDRVSHAPPIADRRPVTTTQHGVARVDDYAWLRDPQWQEVLRDPSRLDVAIRDHLNAENAYYEAATRDLEPLRRRLVREMRGRIKEADSSLPRPDGDFAYAVRYRDGGEYPVYVRTTREGLREQILFDGDLEAKGEAFFRIASVVHSPDHSLIACGVDRLGSEYYDLTVRHIESGEALPETISQTGGHVVWAADSRSFFYVERDENQRPKRVKHHLLGSTLAEDLLVYEEPDDSYFLGIHASQSREYLFIGSTKGTSTEYRYLALDASPGTEPRVMAPRVEDELYYPHHHGEHFYLRTNAQGAMDFKLVVTPVASPGREHWQDWLPHQDGRYVSDLITLKDWLIRLERREALPRLVVSDYARSESFELDFPDPAYNLELSRGLEFDTRSLRIHYESPSTPVQTFDVDLKSHKRVLRKQQEIPSGHDPGLYAVERLFVTADDGAQIPVTLLRLKTTRADGTTPLLLYGYGSYGTTMQAWFSSALLSLVDRGVVYATAHVRGGSDNGRQWYQDGKLANKNHSFTDFARVAEALQDRGYGGNGRTVSYGGSAGGLLVGATLNLRPDLFGGAIAAVPFVDVLNTISDADLPLTPPEWVEWGDPINDQTAFQTIAGYSPYDNIRKDVDYPPLLATGGLTDYRVTYWEPAKWVARLRAEATGGPFFLKMNMAAGHSGSAARFERLEERAHEYAFALKVFGLEDRAPVRHG